MVVVSKFTVGSAYNFHNYKKKPTQNMYVVARVILLKETKK